MNKSKVLNFVQKYTMILVLVLVVIFFASQKDGALLKPNNLTNLIAQNAYVFVLATGMLLCILTGGNIDLSVGSVVCFVGAIGGMLLRTAGWPTIPTALVMLAIGIAIGAWQAFWIAYVRVPPFITTLSGMLLFRGLSNCSFMLNGKTIPLFDTMPFVKIFGGGADCYLPDFKLTLSDGLGKFLGGNQISVICLIVGIVAAAVFVALTLVVRMSRKRKGYAVESLAAYLVKTILIVLVILYMSLKLSLHKGLPTVLIWVALVVGIYAYITSKTTIGRHFYAVGGNEKAAKLSGINTNRVYFLAYTSMGMLAALASMLVTARMVAATTQAGDGYEMDAIGSCFIGGASAYGGIGTVPGVIIGALLMGVINMGMNITNVDQNYQKVVKGLVLLAAVIFDVVTKKRKS